MFFSYFRFKQTSEAEVIIRDSIIQQLPQYSNVPLSIQANDFEGYQKPLAINAFGSNYLYLGLIPKDLIKEGTTQGYSANGESFSFNNCDGNANSYFAFYKNVEFDPNTDLISSCCPLFGKWMEGAEVASNMFPDEFLMRFEEHQGGCGARGFNHQLEFSHTVDGVALGLIFKKPGNNNTTINFSNLFPRFHTVLRGVDLWNSVSNVEIFLYSPIAIEDGDF